MSNLNIIKSVFLVIIAVVYFSCGDDNLNSNLNSSNEKIENRSMRYSEFTQNSGVIDDQLILSAKENLARELSILVQSDPRVYDAFVALVNASRDSSHYEEEFFWNLDKDKSLPSLNGSSLSDLLISLNSDNNILLDFICANIPALTILKEGDSSSESIDSKIYYDDGFDDMDENSVIPFYENGIKGETSIFNLPMKQVYIVRECETYISESDMDSESYAKTSNPKRLVGTVCGHDIITWSPIVFPPGGSGGGGGGGTGPGNNPCDCERDCIDKTENIHRLRARDDYDPCRGKGEFLFYTIFAQGVTYDEVDGQIEIYGDALSYDRHRYDGVEDNDEWVTPNFEIIMWDLSKDGNRMKHVLYEEDYGDIIKTPIKLSFEFKGISVEQEIQLQIKDGHDLIGESIVDYCQDIDPNGFVYHPSNNVDFTLNER